MDGVLEGMTLEKAPIPRTLDTYIAVSQMAKDALQMIDPPSLGKDDYSVLWVIRSHFFAELRARGIERVSVPKRMLASDMLLAFPDQGEWLRVVIRSTGANTTMDLVSKLGAPLLTLHAFCDAHRHLRSSNYTTTGLRSNYTTT